jgi:division protein CdvB (Snf7/Vps24/ESCRT-III family)
MCLDRFLEDLELEFEEILWRDNPERVLAEKILRLRNVAKSTQAALARISTTIERLECRIAPLQQLKSDLSERVEIYLYVGDRANAWRHALELDRIREELAAIARQVALQQRSRDAEVAKLEDLQQEISSLQSVVCY